MADNLNEVSKAVKTDPMLVLLLGACPAVSAACGVIPALWLALSVFAIMLVMGLVAGLVGKLVPGEVRIPVFLLLAAALAGCAQMLLNAFAPDSYKLLGVYIAVIAVNLCVLCTAEKGAEYGVGAGLKAAVVNGLILAAAIIVVAALREVFGAAAFAGKAIPFLAPYTVPLLTKAPGGLIVFAIVLAVINKSGSFSEGKGFACAAAGVEKKGE